MASRAGVRWYRASNWSCRAEGPAGGVSAGPFDGVRAMARAGGIRPDTPMHGGFGEFTCIVGLRPLTYPYIL